MPGPIEGYFPSNMHGWAPTRFGAWPPTNMTDGTRECLAPPNT